MKTSKSLWMLLLASVLVAASPATQPVEEGDGPDVAARPAGVGALNEGQRTNIAARGGPADDQARLFVIAPAGVGFTATATPALYWYLSAGTKDSVDVVINRKDDDNIHPKAFAKLHLRGAAAGLHRFDLAKPLAADAVYTFAVERRNPYKENKPGPMGILKFHPPETPPDPADAAVLARSGYWYDVMAALNRRAADPSDEAARRWRERLLRKDHVLVREGAPADDDLPVLAALRTAKVTVDK